MQEKISFDINQLVLIKEEIEFGMSIFYEYEGKFTNEIIKEFLYQIDKLSKNNVKLYKKLFYILIELAQNVNRYSNWREDDQGVGAVIIAENDKEVELLIGNVISNSALKVLLKKCDIINSLDRESLRLFKRQQRNLIPGTNKGAHIGLIMLALITKKPLDIRIKQINKSYSYFIIRVKIEKSQL